MAATKLNAAFATRRKPAQECKTAQLHGGAHKDVVASPAGHRAQGLGGFGFPGVVARANHTRSRIPAVAA